MRLFDSPQAAQFRAAIAGTVGGDFNVTATERIGDIHVYRVDGPDERGLLLELADAALTEGVYQHRIAFYHRHSSLPLQLWCELVAHGWDAHLAASQSGDRSVLDLPAKRRYARRDELSSQVARARDECRQSIFGLEGDGPVWPSLPKGRLSQLWWAHCATTTILQ
ncbi:MAG: hypothetical protein M3548_00685 [Actinomycetota bacterium]|nr:hypothetical protein [Actinomycetota bacterium]